MQRILVPVDFSPSASEAVARAVDLAKALGAGVTLLHIYEPPTMMAPIVPGADNDADAAFARSRSDELLHTLAATLTSRGFEHVETAVVEGFPVESIVAYAARHAFDMVVMGTRGRSGLNRLLVGSVAEGVMRRTHCPVLMVHLPKPEASTAG